MSLSSSTTGRADEAAAVKVIKALVGRVKVDDKRLGEPVVSMDLAYTQVTDAGLAELKELKGLQSLDVRYTQVTDAGLAELKELKSLKSLNLSYTPVTDAGVWELKAALPEIMITF